MDQANLNHYDTPVIRIATSKEEAFRLLRFIREYLEEYFFAKPSLTMDTFVSTHTVSPRDKELLTSITPSFFTNFTRNNCYQILKDMSDQIEKYPVVTVYTPVGMDKENTQKLAKWFKENLSPTALMDLKTDDKLIGGISFVWNGVKHEYSFKILFNKKKEEILKMINSIGNT